MIYKNKRDFKQNKYMILAVDFDGTLHCGIYPAIGVPVPYAIKKMRKLKEDGHYLIINTCRCDEHLIAAINWLLEKGIPFDRVNDNHPDGVKLHNSNSRKVFADVYVDDRQVGGLPTWPQIYDYIASFVKPSADSIATDVTFPYAFDYVAEQSTQRVLKDCETKQNCKGRVDESREWLSATNLNELK